jgi:hypothetical protein
MKIADISKALEINEDKNLVASVKKILRAYEQTFSEDVDVMSVLADIEIFFERMQDRYENAFTIRNILSGQQKLLDLPIVRERLPELQYKNLQELTRMRASVFTKTANGKQRTKVTDDASGRESMEEAGRKQDEEADVEASEPIDSTDGSRDLSTSLESTIKEQSEQILHLKGRIHKLESFIAAVRVVLNLVD